MQGSQSSARLVVAADGAGIVSHEGTVLLGGLADRVGLTGLAGEKHGVLGGVRERGGGHALGRVLTDPAVMIAGGGKAVAYVSLLGDQLGLHGRVGSDDVLRVLPALADKGQPGLDALARGRARAPAGAGDAAIAARRLDQLPDEEFAAYDLPPADIVNRPGFGGGLDLTDLAWYVLIVVDAEQLVNGHGFAAVTALAAEADPGAGPLAVRAPLDAEVALVAFGALVDGDVATGLAGRRGHGGHRGRRVALAGSPRGLPARRGAVGLPADPGEPEPARRADSLPGSSSGWLSRLLSRLMSSPMSSRRGPNGGLRGRPPGRWAGLLGGLPDLFVLDGGDMVQGPVQPVGVEP